MKQKLISVFYNTSNKEMKHSKFLHKEEVVNNILKTTQDLLEHWKLKNKPEAPQKNLENLTIEPTKRPR